MPLDKKMIRMQNKAQVKKTLFQHEHLLASELVKQTGISMVTINSVLKELVLEGIVLEGQTIQKEVGRPAVEYRFNYDGVQNLFISFQEKNQQVTVTFYITNLKCDIQFEEIKKCVAIEPMAFKKCITEVLELHPYISTIAVMCPAEIQSGAIMNRWTEEKSLWGIKKLVAEVTDIPCYIQNDAHILTVGHCILHKQSLKETIVGIYCPNEHTPKISLVSQGNLIEGRNSLAGEAKYLPFFLEEKEPRVDQERITELLAFYNAAIAPNTIVLIVASSFQKKLMQKILTSPLLEKQPNKPVFEFVDQFEKCLILGLHWLIYQNTPYDLAV